jgi:hypothetical protein
MTDVLEDTTGTQNVIRSFLFSMVPEESVAFTFFVFEYLKEKKNRRWWVHPMNAVRHRDGHFYTLCKVLREDPANKQKKKTNSVALSPRANYTD